MPDLIVPTSGLHAAWLEAHEEWGPGLHEDGFGLLQSDEVESTHGFTVWVERITTDKHCTYRWITEGDQVLGGIALRHESSPLIQAAGHLGYGIRPSARRRGLAAWALARMVEQARALGMNRVSAVCEVGNMGSAKTIERQGGVPDGGRNTGTTLRYWIST